MLHVIGVAPLRQSHRRNEICALACEPLVREKKQRLYAAGGVAPGVCVSEGDELLDRFGELASVAFVWGPVVIAAGGWDLGLLTRVEISHIRIASEGNGRINSRGSSSPPSQRT